MEEAKVKLDKELHNLALLKETMAKSNQLANGMSNILTSFEDRLAKLEKTILPVYHETENLQRRQENIENSLKSLDYVIQYFSVPRRVEPIIREGLNDNLDVFLKSMDDLNHAKEFFTKTRANSDELDEITSLFSTGGNALQKEFRTLLNRSSKPVPPIVLLDLVNTDDEITQEDDKVILEQLPEKVIRQLVQIANWLRDNRSENEDYTNIYCAIRASIFQKSIQGLKEHQKSSSGNSSTMAIHNSPMLGGRKNLGRDTPSKKASKKIQQALMKKATAAIMKYSPNVESSAFGHKLQLMQDPKDEITDQEIEAFLTCITALHKLMQSEQQLMQEIIPEEHQVPIFERILQPGVDSVVSEGDALIARVKKCVAKHDFSVALTLFPILRHLSAMKTEFELLLDGENSPSRSKIRSLLVTTQITMNKALEEFIENIKNDQETKMPKDGTVHELTSNVMILLEQLQDFVDMAGVVLCIADTSNMKVAKNSQDLGRYSLAQYITRVLAALGLALQNKSEIYNDAFLKAIFRLNNLTYILKSLQRTSLSKIVSEFNSDLECHYNDEIREQKRVYSQSWSRVLHYIMEVDKPLSQQRTALTGSLPHNSSMKLKDKEKQNIKDRFTGFNKEMEEVFRIQKGYAIPAVELRESLKRDNKEYILPKYQIFYDKYVQTAFTKNPDKYLKYTPLQVSELIDKFFDTAA